MVKNVKQTKKFEKKHLKGVLERRKVVQKIKQKEQIKQKKQAKKHQDDAFIKGPDGGKQPVRVRKNLGTAAAGEMTVDDFFQGGFEILDKKTKDASGKLGKRKRDDEEESDAEEEEQSQDDEGSEVDFSDDGIAHDEVSDDEEEDDEVVDDTAPTGMTKEAMASLAEKDPEFYKFLKENDPEALEFDENAEFSEIDELSGSEAEGEEPKKKKQKKDTKAADDENGSELTQKMIAKWKAQIEETKSLRAARQVVIAFRCAAHLNEDDDEKPQRYTIHDPNAFNDILVLALGKIPEVLTHHVPVKESSSGKTYVNTDTKKFKILSQLVKNYAASIIHLLGTLSDEPTLKLTISALEPILPYLLSFRKLLKVLIKTVVAFWSQSASTEATRITAFLVARRLMVISDKGVRETVLKAVYQGLVQGCRLTNVNTVAGINIMKNSAAELWGLDQTLGYTTAFGFIRQLAIHLRNSIVNNKNNAFRNVYNWQYVHSLDFWSCVLAEHCSPLKEAEAGKESQLKLLIYPLVQVTLGAMRLIPTALYFPLRFQLVRSLLRLSRATDTYIPLASILLEVLNSAEMKKPPKSSTLKPLDFATAYKAPKSYLRTRVYQDGLGEQVIELLGEYFVLWSRNIAFPEFSLPVVVALKRWLKDSRKKSSGNNNGKIGTQLALLVQKIESNAKFIEDKRNRVEFAPNDRTQVDAFLRDFEWEKTPLGAYVVGQRKLRAEKRKMMEEARKEDELRRKEDEEEERLGKQQDENSDDEEDDHDDLAKDDDEDEEEEGDDDDDDDDEEDEDEDDE
ncbi:Noc2p family-domain-containing protein [Pseudoneurospora amorphoporcata]|uniref:Noc2p family-domain-containing protein n=1 Tax=Pseudoneurospora amorphoporcata TaxID=241081 RepID=A0AAN6NX73_9PEZI|nr:Noc2p family-domain-containing protein [Pseudoneurospora amorphoporcata]